LAPTATFHFVRCIEALAFYVIIYEQISSTNIEVMTSDTLKPQNLGPDQQEEELAAHCWTEERGQALQGL
jgi:hypothetical protein